MQSYKRVIEASSTHKPFRGILLNDGSKAVVVAKDNGATPAVYFGAIQGGVIMGKITASGKYRPCGKQVVDDAQTSVNEIDMESVDGFEVGDVVNIWDVSGDTNLVTGRIITAIDDASTPPSLTISGGAVTVAIGDYAYVNDGSGVARGIMDEEGVSTLAGQDINGLARSEDAGARIIYRGVVDETLLNAVHNLSDPIKADLVNQITGCDITFQ